MEPVNSGTLGFRVAPAVVDGGERRVGMPVKRRRKYALALHATVGVLEPVNSGKLGFGVAPAVVDGGERRVGIPVERKEKRCCRVTHAA